MVYLGECLCAIEKNYVICCCLVKCSMHINYNNLSGCVVQVFYTLNDFPSTCSINDREVLTSPIIFVNF